MGAELRASMGSADRGIIDVTHLGSLNITTAPAATSDNFTALQIEGGLCKSTKVAGCQFRIQPKQHCRTLTVGGNTHRLLLFAVRLHAGLVVLSFLCLVLLFLG